MSRNQSDERQASGHAHIPNASHRPQIHPELTTESTTRNIRTVQLAVAHTLFR